MSILRSELQEHALEDRSDGVSVRDVFGRFAIAGNGELGIVERGIVLATAPSSRACRRDEPHEPTFETPIAAKRVEVLRCNEQRILNRIVGVVVRSAVTTPGSEEP